MFEAIVLIAIIAYIAFRNWLHHDRRRMIHRERMAAIEKGAELPALEQEVAKNSWNLQRFLLLAGICWVSIGVGGAAVLAFLSRHPRPDWGNEIPPPGIELAGIIPIGIGIAHLVTYWVGERRDHSKGLVS